MGVEGSGVGGWDVIQNQTSPDFRFPEVGICIFLIQFYYPLPSQTSQMSHQISQLTDDILMHV